MKAKVKVGIFGGSFNPIHNGHLILATKAKEENHLDYVIFVPVHRPPKRYKSNRDFEANKHRVAMIESAIGTHSYFIWDDIEIQREGTSYTIDTIRLLRKKMPNAEFHFICGEDTYKTRTTWKRWNTLRKMVKFIVFKRKGGDFEMGISSTMIRKRIQKGLPVNYMIPDKVREYIINHKLYKRT